MLCRKSTLASFDSGLKYFRWKVGYPQEPTPPKSTLGYFNSQVKKVRKVSWAASHDHRSNGPEYPRVLSIELTYMILYPSR